MRMKEQRTSGSARQVSSLMTTAKRRPRVRGMRRRELYDSNRQQGIDRMIALAHNASAAFRRATLRGYRAALRWPSVVSWQAASLASQSWSALAALVAAVALNFATVY